MHEKLFKLKLRKYISVTFLTYFDFQYERIPTVQDLFSARMICSVPNDSFFKTINRYLLDKCNGYNNHVDKKIQVYCSGSMGSDSIDFMGQDIINAAPNPKALPW